MVRKAEEEMTTLQVTKRLAKELQGLSKGWRDTYEAIIWRLLNGSKGEPHGDREDEPTRIGDDERG